MADELKAAQKARDELLERAYKLDGQIAGLRQKKLKVSGELQEALQRLEDLERGAADAEREKVFAELEQAREVNA